MVPESFSVRWTGCVQTPAAAGLYTFTAKTDDGVRLWVNGQLVVDWWQYQAANDHSGTINLAADTKYDIQMDYFEGGGDASAQLRWTPPGGSDVVIPTIYLYPQVAPPAIEPAGGSLPNSVIVYITSAASGATIYYSVDGVDPVPGNPNTFPYTVPIAVSSTTTVKAIAVKTGLANSDVASATYTIADTTAPTLVDALPSGTNTVRVRFSEALDPTTAQTTGNYTITGLTVSGAALLTNPPNTVTVTTTADFTPGTTYTVTVNNVRDLNNNTIAANSTVQFTYVPVGLYATYRDNWDFTGATFERADSVVDFNWAGNSPDASIGDETFSARWLGYILPEFTETYTFYVTSDDGVRLWVNDQILIDQWVSWPITSSATLALTAGTLYPIRLEYCENTGNAFVHLEWSSLHQQREVIPVHRLLRKAAPPTISPNGGTFTDGVAVTLSSPFPGTQIRYTTDGSTPTSTTGTLYTGPFALNAGATVRAVAYNNYLAASEVMVSNAFTISDAAAPTLSWVRATRPTSVLVRFSEPVAAAGANTAANYVIEGGAVAVSSAFLGADLQTVRLTTAALTPGTNYSLAVSNVTDTAGTPHAIAAGSTCGFTYLAPLAGTVNSWAFDEGTGTNLADSVGSNNGVLENSPPWAASPVGFAVNFDGSQEFADLAADLSPTLGVTSSVSFWIRTTQVHSPARPAWEFWFYPGITGVEDSNGGNDVFWGILNDTGRICGRAGDVATITSANPINNDAWHHVAITWDSATGEMILYVDGAQSATGTTDVGPKTSPFDSLARITKWSSTNGAPSMPPNYYRGGLSDVRTFNKVLTPAEVAILANRAPTVYAGPDVTVGVGQTANLAGTASDPDNLPSGTLSYLWTLVGGPAGGTVTFGTSTAASTTAVFSAAGTYVVRLIVSDGSLSCSDDVVVTTSGVVVTPITGLITSEAGGTDTFTMYLSMAPAAGQTVQVNVHTSNPQEGTVSPASATFDSTNWNIPVTFTVMGVDDTILDFGVPYTIITDPAISGDPNFSGTDPADVSVTNMDDESIPEPDRVWGGCGLLGPEVLLSLLGWGAVRRRRLRR